MIEKWAQIGRKRCAHVPFWGFLISGKKLLAFSGVFSAACGPRHVPFWGFLISGKKLLAFSGVFSAAMRRAHVPFSGFLISGKKVFGFWGEGRRCVVYFLIRFFHNCIQLAQIQCGQVGVALPEVLAVRPFKIVAAVVRVFGRKFAAH